MNTDLPASAAAALDRNHLERRRTEIREADRLTYAAFRADALALAAQRTRGPAIEAVDARALSETEYATARSKVTRPSL